MRVRFSVLCFFALAAVCISQPRAFGGTFAKNLSSAGAEFAGGEDIRSASAAGISGAVAAAGKREEVASATGSEVVSAGARAVSEAAGKMGNQNAHSLAGKEGKTEKNKAVGGSPNVDSEPLPGENLEEYPKTGLGGGAQWAGNAGGGFAGGVEVEKLQSGKESAKPGVLDEFAVTAYRFESAPLESPVNSTFIGDRKISESPYYNVADVISRYGNVNFRSYTGSNSFGEFSMRGFGENSHTRVLVMVDGQRFNRADMGGINWLQIPLSNVESVEILRGSQSALYGSSAESGVIKITTLRAKEDGVHVQTQGIYGQYSTYNLAAHASGRDGKYFFTTDVNYFSSDGWRENSASRAASANISLGRELGSNSEFILTGNYTDSSVNFPGPLTLEEYHSDPRKSDGKGSNMRSRDGVYTAVLKNKSSIGEGEIALGANFRDIDWNMGGISQNFQWTGSVMPRYRFDVGQSGHLLLGFDGTYDDIDYKLHFKDSSAQAAGVGDNAQYLKGFAKVWRTSLAPYFGGDYEVSDGLVVTAVGRYDASKISARNTDYFSESIYPTIWVPVIIGGQTHYFPEKNPNYPAKVNPLTSYNASKCMDGFGANFAANWRLRSDTSIFFKFDQIYHYPTTDEIASYQNGGLVIPFNFSLKPETGQNYEVGIKYISGGWSFVGSVFLMDLRDEISYAEAFGDNGDSYWINTNLPPTLRYGTDIEARYDSQYWGVGAMFSAVKAQFEGGRFDGNSVPLVPEFYGNISAYLRPLEWITISARLNFMSEQRVGSDYSNLIEKIPAYALADFQINFNFSRYGSLFLAVENAFDKRYISCAWASGYYPGMGRMMKIGVNLKF